MAKPRRKKRTSIRTAAGTVQDQYIARMQTFASNPMVALPVCPDGDPKSIAKIRSKVEKMAKGKISWLDRKDSGIVGAVAHALPLAALEAVPRIADAKVGGKRRFYLQRGNVVRGCSLGVQNFDDPLALLMAYRQMAKDQKLHFFADPGLWCSGTTPNPPAEWVTTIAEGLELESDGLYGCTHAEIERIQLQFREGPAIAVCGPCGKSWGPMHGRISARYAGPRQRQPVEVLRRLPDGTTAELDAEKVAAYRGGLIGEVGLLKS